MCFRLVELCETLPPLRILPGDAGFTEGGGVGGNPSSDGPFFRPAGFAPLHLLEQRTAAPLGANVST